jgi:nitrate reductase gamma subunit
MTLPVPGPLSMMAAAPLTMMMVAQAAFTAGAVAGTAGVVGLIALRRYMKQRDSHQRSYMGSDSMTASAGADDMST